MKRYDLITPEGTTDLIFEECISLRKVQSDLSGLFNNMGYSEVITPGIEFFDVFNKPSSTMAQETLYKLCDTKGRLITMRPDSTIPIARMVATRLRDFSLPLRLYYNQSIFSISPSLTGRKNEFVQAGIELIGSSSKKADIEVLSIALKALSDFDTENFRLEIGDIGYFTELVSNLDVDSTVREEIRRLIEVKNYTALNDLLDSIGNNEITKALKQLPRLFGGEEVFEKASKLFSDEKINKILFDLKNIYNELNLGGFAGKITVDFGIVNRTNYYTGLVFRGYIRGYGDSVLSGGRYDKLMAEFGADIPAIGFGINVDAISSISRKSVKSPQTKTANILLFAEKGYDVTALSYANNLITDGNVVEFCVCDTIDEAKTYAIKLGILKLCIVSDKIKTITNKGGAWNE